MILGTYQNIITKDNHIANIANISAINEYVNIDDLWLNKKHVDIFVVDVHDEILTVFKNYCVLKNKTLYFIKNEYDFYKIVENGVYDDSYNLKEIQIRTIYMNHLNYTGTLIFVKCGKKTPIYDKNTGKDYLLKWSKKHNCIMDIYGLVKINF